MSLQHERPLHETPSAAEVKQPTDVIKAALTGALSVLERYDSPIACLDELARSDTLSDEQLKELADKTLQNMRGKLDGLPKDQYGSIEKGALPPSKFFEAYGVLHRWRKKPHWELAEELGLGDRLSDGFYNRAAFPDGQGGFHVDDFGMKGQWWFKIQSLKVPSNRFVLRTIDALSRVLNQYHGNGASATVIFADRLGHIDAKGTRVGAGIAVQPSCRTITVTEQCWKLSRHEQAATLSSLLDDRVIEHFARPDTAISPIIPTSRLIIPSGDRSDLTMVFLASLRPNRAADYANHRFNYRIEAYAQKLSDGGHDVTSAVVEDSESFSSFLGAYKQRPTDIVLFSLYQHKQEDLEWAHALTAELRRINPQAFLVVEGPAAIMFKQFLCLLPEINMLIRGEAQGIIEALLELKRKNLGLTEQDVLDLTARRIIGFFIRSVADPSERSEEIGIISNADRSNLDREPVLIHPRRSLFDEWFCQRGCPERCHFCHSPEGLIIKGRTIDARGRIVWMVERLRMEIDEEWPSVDALIEILKEQAPSSDLLDQRFRLLSDSFIGRTQISLTLLGQNETANNKVIIDWARQIKAMGLQKYFRIKIADAALASLRKRQGPGASKTAEANRDLVQALKDANVTFIGMGIENLQSDILVDLEKGYNADLPITVVKAFHETGFDPGGIRGNIVASTPDSTMTVVHASSLLLYVSPIYNSVLFRFANGWGNARSPRIYSNGASLWSSIGIARNPECCKFNDITTASRLKATDSIVRHGDFFVPLDTNEYTIQEEISYIRYIDERIPVMMHQFLYPVFYRYHIVAYFGSHLSDAEIQSAMDVLEKDEKSSQVASFVHIFKLYRTLLPHLPLLRVIRNIKADMVALELFSFEDYQSILAGAPDLPCRLEQGGVAAVFERGDEALIPGQFDPDQALDCLADAGIRARRVLLSASVGDAEASWAVPRSTTAEGGLWTLDDVIAHYQARRREARALAYRLMAYPDVQQIDWLGGVYAMDNDEELFSRVIGRMNQKKLHAAAAVEDLIRERLTISADDYGRLVKSSKSFSNGHLFANAGLLRRLKEGLPVAEQLRRLLDQEHDALVARVIQANLSEFDRRAARRA